MELFRSPPLPTAYIALSEHQSRTPASFYAGSPVLHHRSDRCKILILSEDLSRVPAISALTLSGKEAANNGHGEGGRNGHPARQDEVAIEGVDVWVTSEKLLLFSPTTETGASIPYPSISLHAIQALPAPAPGAASTDPGQGLYMQVVVSPESDEEELDTIALTLIPSFPSPPSQPHSQETSNPAATQTETQKIFEALSACSNLHPDPVVQGDGDDDGMQSSMAFRAGLIQQGRSDGGLPPSFAEGGWITAENMHEFVDVEGNLISGGGDEDEEMYDGEAEREALGPGAGTVRAREPEENGGPHGADGDGEGQGTKWQRTD